MPFPWYEWSCWVHPKQASHYTDSTNNYCSSVPGTVLGTSDIIMTKIGHSETSLAVQWLSLRASTAGGTGSTLGRGTKSLHATHMAQPKKMGMASKRRFPSDSAPAACLVPTDALASDENKGLGVRQA